MRKVKMNIFVIRKEMSLSSCIQFFVKKKTILFQKIEFIFNHDIIIKQTNNIMERIIEKLSIQQLLFQIKDYGLNLF